jgi:indole-3-glycerol phosphate synthase
MIDIDYLKLIINEKSTKNIFDIFKLSESKNMLSLEEKHNGGEMDTFGNLVDKLCIVNSKMWHNQEILYEIRKMTEEQFAEKYGNKLQELHKIVSRCCDLNVQRSKLIDEIDIFLSKVTKNEDIVRQQHKMY